MTDSDSVMQGAERPAHAMYKSLVLKRAIEVLYMTQPWRNAIVLPWSKDNGWEPSSESIHHLDSKRDCNQV